MGRRRILRSGRRADGRAILFFHIAVVLFRKFDEQAEDLLEHDENGFEHDFASLRLRQIDEYAEDFDEQDAASLRLRQTGEHDENISFEQAQAHCQHTLAAHTDRGAQLCEEARNAALQLYREAADYAASRGILIADTKFEFGIDAAGTLHLIDEALTPDSSRFWPADEYRAGSNPPSFDKQYVRDYLETLTWNKTAPGPKLPAEVIARTSAKYREAFERLTGQPLPV